MSDTAGVLVVGDTTIDLYPTDDAPITDGSAFEWHVGGTAANVARWLAELGDDATIVTNVGTDTAGEMAARHLDASPVQTHRVARVDGTSPLDAIRTDSRRRSLGRVGSRELLRLHPARRSGIARRAVRLGSS